MQKKYEQEVIDSVVQYIPKLISGIELLIDSLRSQDTRKALDIFPLILDGLDWSVKAFYSINEPILKKNLDERRLVSIMQELLEAMENEDYVLVADMLEYELLEILIIMKKNIQALD